MSILFGVREFERQRSPVPHLSTLARTVAMHPCDREATRVETSVALGLRHVIGHRRAEMSLGVEADVDGHLVSFDGRLDNAHELCTELGLDEMRNSDGAVVLKLFAAQGEGCFARLVGDWALALWSPRNESLYLARDHAGTRPLYFAFERDRLIWGTRLELFFADRSRREINPDYVASFLSSGLSHLLTPYEGIRVVPPAHVVVNRKPGVVHFRAHWNWMKVQLIRYGRAEDYEEHFRMLFQQAVERRTEDHDGPLLAELSGGVDSSSIVCMSDRVRKQRDGSSADFIDTLSFYDREDKDWGELPFVQHVEEQRGKRGTHRELPLFDDDVSTPLEHFLVPGFNGATARNRAWLQSFVTAGGYRAVLSGLGGDELLGGVPTGDPELGDYLVRADLASFVSQALAWSLPDRTPLIRTMWNATKLVLSNYQKQSSCSFESVPGATAKLRDMIRDYEHEVSFTDPRGWRPPSRTVNGRTWWKILETLPHQRPYGPSRVEYRYPFLDRDLVDFLFAVPRERLLQPGRRRAMLRAAMRDIVPEPVLERRRKAYRSRALLPHLISGRGGLRSLLRDGYVVEAGLVQQSKLLDAIDAVGQSATVPIQGLSRIVLLELWMRNQDRGGPTAQRL